MDVRRLLLACHNQASAAMFLQITRYGRDPARMGRELLGSAGRRALDLQDMRNLLRNGGNVACRHGNPVVRHGARQRRCTLSDIKTVHCGYSVATGLGFPAAGGEVARMPQISCSGSQKIGIQGEDNVGLVEMVSRLEPLAESPPRSLRDRVAHDGLVTVPVRLRKLLMKPSELISKGRRKYRRGQDTQPVPLDCFHLDANV